MTRLVLQAENVGPDGNSLYVLRVVATGYRFAVEIVDVRGKVIHLEVRFHTERGARYRANKIYTACRQANGYTKGILS